MNQPTDILVREVGLRDGLQNTATFVPTQAKLAWIAAELEAGVREIEVTSFVPPKLIPQFADAEEVAVQALRMPGLTVMTLVPNLRGAERAFALGVHKVDYVVSVSRTHNLKNVRREREESLADFKRIVQARDAAGLKGRTELAAGLSTALGCSYEGRIAVDEVRRCAAFLAEAGAEEIMVADTVGYADPKQVREVFKAVLAETGNIPLAAHFHDTRGIGLANVSAALDCGISRFDASLGGLGGCPYAPGASGNVCSEEIVHALALMGYDTGVDLAQLVAVARQLPALIDHDIPSQIAKAGPRLALHPVPADFEAIRERALAR